MHSRDFPNRRITGYGKSLKMSTLAIFLILSHINAELSSPPSRKWHAIEDNCTVPAPRCIPIKPELKNSCLGNPLPYDLTTENPLTEDVALFDLHIWSSMKMVPACWAKLQVFLCAVYVPECREDGDQRSVSGQLSVQTTAGRSARVVLPEEEMCLAVHKSCPLLFTDDLEDKTAATDRAAAGQLEQERQHRNVSLGRGLLGQKVPQFLQCDNYIRGCRQNKLTDRIFRVSHAVCQPPLVSTANKQNWIKGIDSCSFPCRRPLFRPEEYSLARNLTFCASIAGIVLNLFVLATLMVLPTTFSLLFSRDGSSTTSTSSSHRPACHLLCTANPDPPPPPLPSSAVGPTCCHHHNQEIDGATIPCAVGGFYRLPHTALFFIHLAFLVGCIGWLLPHLPAVGDRIACRPDGSVRVGEPKHMNDNFGLCLLAFVLIYFPLLVAALWSVIFDYAVFSTFRELCKRAASISPPSTSPIRGESVPLQQQQHQQQQFYHYHNLQQRRSCWLPIIKPSFTLDSVSTCRPLLSPDTCEMRRIVRGGDGPAGVVGPLDTGVMGSTSPVTTTTTTTAAASCATSGVEFLPPTTAAGTNEPDQDLALDADSNFQGVSKRPTRCWWHHEPELGPQFIHHPLICRLLWLHPDLSPGHGLQQALLDSSGTCDGDIARDGYQRFTESSRRRQVRDFNSTPMEKQLTCVHIVVVAVPILFVFISLTGSQIDGEPLSGLCFVGITSLWAHCALVVFPLGMCLFLKAVYLCRAMLFMSQLRSKFAESFFLVDREMAHRLVMSIRAYVIYLLALLGLLLFFVGVHSYVYVQQPHWLESQRNFFFCQLRHRLMGLDVFAASVACHSPSSVFSVLQFGAVRQQTQQFPPLPPLIHSSAAAAVAAATPTTSSSPTESLMVGDSQRKPASSARLVTTDAGRVLRRIARDFNPSSVAAAAAAADDAPPLLSPFDPFLMGHGGSGGGGANGSGSVFGFSESARPLTGPIFLNLLTYFAVNLIFASMCLLDVSVKRRWGQLFRRIARAIYPRRNNSSVAYDRRKKMMGAATGAASEAVSFASSTPSCCFNGGGGGGGNGNQVPSYCTEIAMDRLPLSFSWWDPGVFFLFPTRPAATTTSLPLRKLARPPTCDCGVILSGTAEAKPRQLQEHQQAASPRENDTAQPTHTSGSATNSSNSQNAVTLRAAVSDVSCSYGRRYSSSTNEESCIASALSSSGIGSCANQGVARSAVTTTTADRGSAVPGNDSSKFRGDVIHKSGSVNSAQSLFLRHHPPPLSSLGGGAPRIPQTTSQSDATARPLSAAAALAASLQPLQAVAAAAAGEIDAHLTAAVALHQTLSRSGRRHRHRRILPGKSLCRRRLASNRSLSITGLPITGLSGLDRASLSNLSASLVRSALRLTAASSTQDLPVADGGGGGISEAQRHSIAASLSRVLAPYCLSAAANANAPAAAAHPSQSPAGNSRATSVLGEGRLSTSSAPIDQQNQPQSQHFRGSSGSINTWRRLSGFNAPPTATAAGSRMSLRSLSYASSTGSGAQSYNSFQLLAEHAGASWRELWRTRMLLMDVLRWAQAVAATNSDPAAGGSNSYYPLPSNTACMGGQGNSGAASEVPPPPPPSSVADEAAAADWTNQLSAMVMYLLSQVQQQQPEDPPPPPPPPTGDPVLMAALVAATAAASAAMQQQQEYNRQRFADEQPSTTTAVDTAAKSPACGVGSATTVAGGAFPISSPHFVSPAGVYPSPGPPPPPLPHPFYQMQSPRFPAPICVGATSPPQFCQRGPPDLLADHHRAFAQAAARAEENVCHLDASAATPSLQPPNPPMWGPGSPQTVVISPTAAAGGGGGWSRPYPPMPTVYAAPPPPVPPSLRHYSPSQQWASAATSVPRHCYPTVWHQSVEATPPHLAPPSQTVLANVSSSSMVPFGPPLTAFPAPALTTGQGGASPSAAAAAAAASLSHWSAHTRRRGRKKALNDEAGLGGSHEDSDAFDSEDDIISDTEEKQTGDGVDDGAQGALHAAVMQAPSQWPLPGCPDEGDSTGYSEAFEAIGGSTRPETEEDDGDISSVSQSASQVVPNCAKTLGLPPKQQQQPTASASGDPAAAAAPSATEARETAKQDR